jgi:hypothetical protein
MRTTITLEPDVAAKVQDLMRERGISFKEAVNRTLRLGFGQSRQARSYEVPVRSLGLKAGIDLTKALHLAAELEDEANLRDLEERK